MSISTDQLILAIERRNSVQLNSDQKAAIKHGTGPLWIIAGPGTGKSEVLTLRTLKLICCDGVDPGAIILTSFTQKAARNLEDRIAERFLYLLSCFPAELSGIDISRMRTGTLHGLCNDILQEYRYEDYKNRRLVDELEGKMMIKQFLSSRVKSTYNGFITDFDFLFQFPNPHAWSISKELRTVIDRIVDDMIDINALKVAGGSFQELSSIYEEYLSIMNTQSACDFAHLQKYFLDFQNSPQGMTFLSGDGVAKAPVEYILVDEYQDTNPIQEEIYFKLSQNTKNLTVVGDDDQALYRFRGGTVDCMIGFGERCLKDWSITPVSINLTENFRSSSGIVDWFNEYINSFSIMKKPNARSTKRPIIAKTGRNTAYDVLLLKETSKAKLVENFATTVRDMKKNNVISDYNQCVLLLPSTKYSSLNAKPYIDALINAGVPYYNPRAKSFQNQIEIQQLLGTFISIFDESVCCAPFYEETVLEWISSYQKVSSSFSELSDYVRKS